MIEFKDVTKTFTGKNTVHALKGVSLKIPAGGIFGVIGQSGAGKSTLIRCINMLERPDSGEVWVDGILMNRLSPKELRQARKETGMIFQHFNLLSSRTVFQNIAFPLELAGVSKDKVRSRVGQLAELVGLTDKLQTYPRQLSGGQKQRVGIARALATEPKLLLCDEATSALDPETTRSVLSLLRTINENLGLTIVLITHEMAVIQQICDHVAVLEDGVLRETGRVIDVFTRPQSQATANMLQGLHGSKLPAELRSKGSANTLVRLTFIDQRAHQPIISQMIRTHDLDVNILYGRIDQMKTTPFGMLLVELDGTREQVTEAVQFLQKNQVEVEVLSP
ncbi:MAG: methionine ABC transporter ATP-binding protein [Bacillota bacterium]|nr:methionine ABC transporter ATP-binding protein [Bacillota bacterium]HHT89461.1 methionine ABC transporter ATP-binding protein [Bacillota bacterium]